jgi:hypothetical protein
VDLRKSLKNAVAFLAVLYCTDPDAGARSGPLRGRLVAQDSRKQLMATVHDIAEQDDSAIIAQCGEDRIAETGGGEGAAGQRKEPRQLRWIAAACEVEIDGRRHSGVADEAPGRGSELICFIPCEHCATVGKT